jgi:hypothetical protein
MADSKSIPCIEIPKLKPLKISLPFGIELNAIQDISKGPPTDCTLIHSLMLQLAPALAGMQCIFKMLGVFAALAKLANADPLSIPGKIIDVAKKAEELLPCFGFALTLPCTIIDILKLILAYLICIIDAVLSILNFRVGIDLNSATGNPVLLASLNCAQNNADASTAQLKEALAVIVDLLAAIEPLLSLAAIPGPVGDAIKKIKKALVAIESALDSGGASAGIEGVQDVVAELESIRNTLQELRQVLDEVRDALPC